MNSKNKKILFYLICAIGIIISRIIPHSPNFTPVLAFALFSGATIANYKSGTTLPLLTFLISDLFLDFLYGYGFHNTMIYVYSSLFIISLIGRFSLKEHSIENITKFSVFSSCLFFVISNLGVFLGGGYPWTLEGLMICYIAAVPFFINTLLSSVFYSFALFKTYTMVFQKNKNFNFKKLFNY